MCDLGSVYPDLQVIDPDDPTYEGDGWTDDEKRCILQATYPD